MSSGFEIENGVKIDYTTAERNTLSASWGASQANTMVYNSDDDRFERWDGAAWQAITMPRDYILKNILTGGTTANRPATPEDYGQYFDTDLGYTIIYNGTNWVDGAGSIV